MKFTLNEINIFSVQCSLQYIAKYIITGSSVYVVEVDVVVVAVVVVVRVAVIIIKIFLT